MKKNKKGRFPTAPGSLPFSIILPPPRVGYGDC